MRRPERTVRSEWRTQEPFKQQPSRQLNCHELMYENQTDFMGRKRRRRPLGETKHLSTETSDLKRPLYDGNRLSYSYNI
jgi:hypothetical protein